MRKMPISILLPRDVLERVDGNSFTRQTSRSDFVRFAIKDFLTKMESANKSENVSEKKSESQKI